MHQDMSSRRKQYTPQFIRAKTDHGVDVELTLSDLLETTGDLQVPNLQDDLQLIESSFSSVELDDCSRDDAWISPAYKKRRTQLNTRTNQHQSETSKNNSNDLSLSWIDDLDGGDLELPPHEVDCNVYEDSSLLNEDSWINELADISQLSALCESQTTTNKEAEIQDNEQNSVSIDDTLLSPVLYTRVQITPHVLSEVCPKRHAAEFNCSTDKLQLNQIADSDESSDPDSSSASPQHVVISQRSAISEESLYQLSPPTSHPSVIISQSSSHSHSTTVPSGEDETILDDLGGSFSRRRQLNSCSARNVPDIMFDIEE